MILVTINGDKNTMLWRKAPICLDLMEYSQIVLKRNYD